MEGVIGYTTAFAGNFAPKSWAFCQGQIMSIAQNTALFSILGTTYGGNGQTTFALPDLRGKAVVGAGQGPGLSNYDLGQQGGTETATLNITQLPAHVHPVQVVITPKINGTTNSASPVNAVYATGTNNLYNFSPSTQMQSFPGTLTAGPAGNGQPFPNMHPVLVLNYVICLQGVFPARN